MQKAPSARRRSIDPPSVARPALAMIVAMALTFVPAAGAGKKLEKLDDERATDTDFAGLSFGGTKSPAKKFKVLVTSKPRVSITTAGRMLCAPRRGNTAKTAEVARTRRTPYSFKVKPTIKRNRFCDLTMTLSSEALSERTTIRGRVFHKRR